MKYSEFKNQWMRKTAADDQKNSRAGGKILKGIGYTGAGIAGTLAADLAHAGGVGGAYLIDKTDVPVLAAKLNKLKMDRFRVNAQLSNLGNMPEAKLRSLIPEGVNLNGDYSINNMKGYLNAYLERNKNDIAHNIDQTSRALNWAQGQALASKEYFKKTHPILTSIIKKLRTLKGRKLR